MPEYPNPAENSGNAPKRGRVFLVGAGPGDPGLMTLRGLQCLKQAHFVLYDGLANTKLLDLAPAATCISVGKHGYDRIWKQQEIHDKLLELAGQGYTVVRLKGGDPAVFARTAEELEFLTDSDVPFEVVPGITAALAASSYVGIPITHRNYASAVAFVTGQQQTGPDAQDLDWQALAAFPGTLVIYMGVTTAEHWSERLMAAGKDPQTPVAIVRRCTWSDQKVIRAQLKEVGSLLTPASKLRPPVLVIVGKVAEMGTEFDWFGRRPLQGCGVLLTRPAGQNDALADSLGELGADVYQQPTLKVSAANDRESLPTAIEQLAEGNVHGLTFSSQHGVDYFMQALLDSGEDCRALAGVKLAVVGPGTAERLTAYGLRADVVPSSQNSFSAAGLLASLDDSLAEQSWVVTTTNRSQGSLAIGLRDKGAVVSEVLCYRTEPERKLRLSVEEALRNQRIHFCTITSQAIAEACCQLLGDYCKQVHPIALSEAIGKRLQQLGWPPVGIAEQNTTEAIQRAIEKAWKLQEAAPKS